MGAKPYPAYKESGVEWIGDIPEHWEVINARRICKQSRRRAHIGDQQLSATQKYGVIPQSLYSQLENSKLVAALGGTDNFIHVDVDNFVISLRSFQGGLERCMYSGSVSPAYTVLTLESLIHPDHFQYLAKSTDFVSALQSVAVGIREGKTINYEQLVLLSFPTPPIEEQKLIASFLDRETGKIDTLVEQQQKLISLLKDKRQSLISHIVTKGLNPNVRMKDSGVEWIGDIPEHWDICSLGLIANISTGSTPDRDREEYWNGGIPWVKTGEVNYSLIEKTEEYISPFGLLRSAAKIAKKGSLLMAMYGQGVTRGRVAILGIDASYNQACAAIVASTKTTSEHLRWYFIAAYPYVRDDGNETSQMNLSSSYISKIKTVIPPLDEQKQIAAFLDTETSRIDQHINKANQSIALLKERRSSLISAAVTGKIDVREAA